MGDPWAPLLTLMGRPWAVMGSHGASMSRPWVSRGSHMGSLSVDHELPMVFDELFIGCPWVSTSLLWVANDLPWASHRSHMGRPLVTQGSHGSPMGSSWIAHESNMGLQ